MDKMDKMDKFVLTARIAWSTTANAERDDANDFVLLFRSL